MSLLKIEKPSSAELKKLKIPKSPRSVGPWSVWQCEPSTFDWLYPDTEIAFIYKGKVKIKTSKEDVEIGPGDLVTFPKGLTCRWEVVEEICKVYRFERR